MEVVISMCGLTVLVDGGITSVEVLSAFFEDSFFISCGSRCLFLPLFYFYFLFPLFLFFLFSFVVQLYLMPQSSPVQEHVLDQSYLVGSDRTVATCRGVGRMAGVHVFFSDLPFFADLYFFIHFSILLYGDLFS